VQFAGLEDHFTGDSCLKVSRGSQHLGTIVRNCRVYIVNAQVEVAEALPCARQCQQLEGV
jgi:hypothetical protein